MKKSTILGVACALLMGGVSAFAQAPATYVEDPAQGYLFNRFKDNWFLQAEGGGNVLFSHQDAVRDFGDRFAPAASLWLGKWFSPILGFRAGANMMMTKGVADYSGAYGAMLDDYNPDGLWKTKVNEFGLGFDAMFNLTNWWCGYRPGRVYDGILYVGGIGYWNTLKDYDGKTSQGYYWGGDKTVALNAGLINSFALSKHVDLYIDLRWTMLANHDDERGTRRCSHDIAAYIGVTYNFNRTEWSAPVVPVCEPAEDCSAIEARLQAANARINDLERELKDCLSRPIAEVKVNNAPLATIIYPINVSRLTNVDKKVLSAVSEVMKSNPTQEYTLTGWADNFTGNDQINIRLRNARVNGVKDYLVKEGVAESQLNATVNHGNRLGDDSKYMELDRAVTIEESK